MKNKLILRTDTQRATVIRQGLDWCRTYGQRSAAAYMVYRQIPRAVIERVLAAGARKDDHPG